MTPTEIEAALKQVRAQKPKENFMAVRLHLDWNEKLILPHKDALLFMEAMKHAEVVKGYDSDTGHITSPDNGVIAIHSLPAEEYEDRKMALLLNVSYDDMKAARKAAKTK